MRKWKPLLAQVVADLFRFADVHDVVAVESYRPTNEKERFPVRRQVTITAEYATGYIIKIDIIGN